MGRDRLTCVDCGSAMVLPNAALPTRCGDCAQKNFDRLCREQNTANLAGSPKVKNKPAPATPKEKGTE